MKRVFPLLALAALAVGCTPTPTDPNPPATTTVELQPVTVVELDRAVASHRGKVVLIDAWFLG